MISIDPPPPPPPPPLLLLLLEEDDEEDEDDEPPPGVGPDVTGVPQAALPAAAGASVDTRAGSIVASAWSTRF